MAQAGGGNNGNSIAKSGWLNRQTTVLHRWKSGWFVLHTSGRLMYYEHQNSSKSEDYIHIPSQRATVLGPEQCKNVTPPEGKSRQCLLGVQTASKTWYMCASDQDDMLAWKLQLEEARNIQPYVPPGISGAGGYNIPPGMQAYYPGGQFRYHGASSAPQYIQAPPGSTVYMTQQGPVTVDQYGNQIMYANQQYPYYYRNRRCGGDAATGFLAGAAVGSLLLWPWMMMPLWFW